MNNLSPQVAWDQPSIESFIKPLAVLQPGHQQRPESWAFAFLMGQSFFSQMLSYPNERQLVVHKEICIY